MSRDKQIEEMANIIAFKAFEQAHLENGDDNLADIVAIELYDNGYRKAEDVAREIIDILKSAGIDEWRYPVIAEIKEKFTEGKR